MRNKHSLKKNNLREKLRHKTKLRHDKETTTLSSLDKVYHPPSLVKVQNTEENTTGGRASVAQVITHSIPGKIVKLGNKRQVQKKRDKIYSNSVPFGYTKAEWNDQLRKVGKL